MTVAEAPAWLAAEATRAKGEFVLVVEGAAANAADDGRPTPKHSACCRCCWRSCLPSARPSWPLRSLARAPMRCTNWRWRSVAGTELERRKRRKAQGRTGTRGGMRRPAPHQRRLCLAVDLAFAEVLPALVGASELASSGTETSSSPARHRLHCRPRRTAGRARRLPCATGDGFRPGWRRGRQSPGGVRRRRTRRARGCVVRAAVVDAQHGDLVVAQVAHQYPAIERQRRMGRGHRAHVEALAVGGLAAMEALAVPRRHAALLERTHVGAQTVQRTATQVAVVLIEAKQVPATGIGLVGLGNFRRACSVVGTAPDFPASAEPPPSGGVAQAASTTAHAVHVPSFASRCQPEKIGRVKFIARVYHRPDAAIPLILLRIMCDLARSARQLPGIHGLARDSGP